jgi:deazaflavin-dependent oxidoreductase (nitroreductase family)
MADDNEVRKRRRVRVVQRYLLNPPAFLAVRAGLVPGYALVETHGRRSGKRRRTVVGIHLEGTTGFVVAEHGRHAGYVQNIQADPSVRVCLRGRWHRARAELLVDDDAATRLDTFGRPRHAANVRRFGTDLLTIRFDIAERLGN